MSRRPRLLATAVGACLTAATLLLPPAAAGEGRLTVDRVAGQAVVRGSVPKPVTGTVTVEGTADPDAGSGSGTEPSAPLVADAGDSPFVEAGDAATLLGAGYGGTGRYRFAWSSPDGTLTGADAATAQLDTTNLAPGRYPVRLEITDEAGRSASDDVVVVVRPGPSVTRQARTDLQPGVFVAPVGHLAHPVEVPAGTARLSAEVAWLTPANDYDVRLLDPSGQMQDESGNPPGQAEVVSVDAPVAGTWTVAIDRWLTAVEPELRITTTLAPQVPDPRPVVDAGGPYRFLTGETQALEGTVEGGASPVAVGWDLDADGLFDDLTGTSGTASLPDGRHVVTMKATDATGLERRYTTTVLVGSAERLALADAPVTVIGVADTGINPYHLEFSADTYPDPAVLDLTENFRRHPSEYIPGYPADAKALDVTLGQGYLPAQDADVWTSDAITADTLYWIPGTKIVGAVDAGGSTGATSGTDPHPILDDNGHGSGSASVSAGNRYGYCPTCLLVVVEALDETVVADLGWVDISSNSFGYIGGLPIGPLVGSGEETRAAAERGQTTLFAAGNGVGNAFDVPVSTYGSDQTGPDWNITVGAIRRDNGRAIVGDGIPVHISAWGDGNLPSACRTGTVGQCAFGGTSAATPYTAGVFGTTLTRVRAAIGDGAAGQKPGQVVAQGVATGSGALADGKLTRQELRDAVLESAEPIRDNEVSPFPYPATSPYLGDDVELLFQGYGTATRDTAERAAAALLGGGTPARPFAEEFFALDRAVRDSIYGGYDRDGDGEEDTSEFDLPAIDVNTVEGALAALAAAATTVRRPAPAVGPSDQLGTPTTYFLHRRPTVKPGAGTPTCPANATESFMDQENTAGDLEPCFESRITSVAAAYRPLGIFASSVDHPDALPAGSKVTVVLFVAGETPSVVRPTGVLMAGDRELGRGAGAPAPVVGSGVGGAGCSALGERCWTRYEFSFGTERPAQAGERLTFQVQLLGARSWAFGYEGGHASSVTVEPAANGATTSEELPADEAAGTEVQWQVVPRHGATDPTAWESTGVEGGSWSFTFDTGGRRGAHEIVTRLIRDGQVLAEERVLVKFR